MAKLKQFLLLIWKNFKLQFRHPWVTLFELGVPTIFSIILVFIRTDVSSTYVSDSTVYSPFIVSSLPGKLVGRQVIYAPNLTHHQKVMNRASSKLKIHPIGFFKEDEMLDYYNNNSDRILAGVVFNSDEGNATAFSNHIGYTIRPKALTKTNLKIPGKAMQTWLTEYTFPLFQSLGPRNSKNNWGGPPGYMLQGFLPLQHAVAMSIIETIQTDKGKEEIFLLQMQRYPYPPYDDDQFLLTLQFFLPLILMLSFIYPSLNIVKNLVVEKEKRLKEAMKMMGLSNWMHWSAWYLKYFLFLSISIIIITVLLTTRFTDHAAVLDSSNPSIIFILLLIYITSTICFCFFLSVLFSKANSAAAGSGIIFFMAFVPYFFIFPRYSQLTHTEKLASCLLSNTALAMSSMVLAMWEGTGKGLQWNTLRVPATPDDSLSMNLILLMLVVDGIIYLILAWYIEAVFPGEYGVPQPWYFPFTHTYWCGSYQDMQDLVELFNSSENPGDFFEREPSGLMSGIQIQGLTKVFSKKKAPAVNNIFINMYRGQITALLGHNGAGKTTTVSMLTGLFPPTSGTAIVNGYDICDDIDGVHSGLGICPQHDVLFDDLTVEEHLYFFCKLKGYIPDSVQSEIDHMITAVGLEDKRKSQAKTLSGGMKRKLSVGIALVGGSQVVILDEPTSGMDPSARRFTWDLLQSEKEYRTILLTTHFMEEADILGDRIAIMANGEVQCCGSPLFLKKKYGAGYHLVMVKQPMCDVSIITSLINSYLPNAELENNIGAELTYILPHSDSHLFEKLFTEIEKMKDTLKISSYGASITTMEEVFIKVGQKSTAIETTTETNISTSSSASALTDSGVLVDDEQKVFTSAKNAAFVQMAEPMKNVGVGLFFQQLLALLLKRILYTMRNWLLTLSQFLLPPLFLVLTLVMIRTLPKPQDSPALTLNLDPFKGTDIPYSFENETSVEKEMADAFVSQFEGINKPVFVNTSGIDFITHLVNLGENDIGQYNLHDIIAASFLHIEAKNKTLLTSLFNNQAYHSPAIALLSMDNMLLKYLMKDYSYDFSATNHPLPRTLLEKGQQQQTQATEAYQIAQDLMFGMSFLISSFAIFIVRERSSKAKHLQRVSGVNLFTFWLATFIWDFINYIIPCVFVLIIFLLFGTDGMSSAHEQGRLSLLFFIHGLSALPFIYCLSFLFDVPSTAYVRLCLFNIIGGIACLITVTIMEMPDLGVTSTAKVLDWIFTIILPNYCLGRSVSNLYQNHQFYNICNGNNIQFICKYLKNTTIFEMAKPCCKGQCDDLCLLWEENYLSWNVPGIGRQLIFLVIQAIIYIVFLTACELNFFRYLKYKLNRHRVTLISPEHESESMMEVVEDDDVGTERERILDTHLADLYSSDRLVLKELTKYYGPLLAVNKLSFGIQRGECFGLLGLNGAGKTTTFKIITGDESLSSGDVYLDSHSIKTGLRKVQRRLGYCPQFDALIDQLTGRETLTMFARLRGMPEAIITYHVTALSNLLSFGMYIDKQVKEYSGGNKRKLSTAVALIGDPSIMFLDEPTTGMDPVSRRCLWNALLQVLRSGRSIVLTSHSMEECEALCNRLVIMVNGKLCCLGSPQHLKNKFGQGFTLIAKVGRKMFSTQNTVLRPFQVTVDSVDDLQETSAVTSISSYDPNQHRREQRVFKNDVENVKNFIEETFRGCILKDIHEGLLHYHIPNPQLSWAQIFGAMERAKTELNIEDYSVGQTTLEQVFLNFARAQRTSSEL